MSDLEARIKEAANGGLSHAVYWACGEKRHAAICSEYRQGKLLFERVLKRFLGGKHLWEIAVPQMAQLATVGRSVHIVTSEHAVGLVRVHAIGATDASNPLLVSRSESDVSQQPSGLCLFDSRDSARAFHRTVGASGSDLSDWRQAWETERPSQSVAIAKRIGIGGRTTDFATELERVLVATFRPETRGRYELGLPGTAA